MLHHPNHLDFNISTLEIEAKLRLHEMKKSDQYLVGFNEYEMIYEMMKQCKLKEYKLYVHYSIRKYC